MLRTVLMDSDKRSAEVERLEVVETGRRRRWSEDEKLKIVLESLQAPRQPHLCSQNRTAEVARRENASKSRGSGAVVAVSGALRPGAGLPKARKLGVFPDRRISTNILILRSEEHTSELQSLMRNSYAVFCLTKKKQKTKTQTQSIRI